MYSLQVYRIFLIALMISSVSAWYFDCPDMKPKCRCTNNEGSYRNDVQCRGLDYNELHSVLEKASNYDFDTFEIAKANLTVVNETLFPVIKVSTLALLFCQIETFHLFKGLSSLRNLTQLIIEHVDVKEWKFTYAGMDSNNLNEIESLQLLDCPEGNDNHYRILEHLPKSMKSTTVFWCKLKNISFYKFTDIKEINLRYNQLETIERDHFPRPALELSFLCISHNPIAFLPDDIFVDMPKLSTICMEWTSLTTLSSSIFKPILNQLRSLQVANNPLKCDCNNVWIVTKASNWKGESLECESPEYLKNKQISSLNPTQMCRSQEDALTDRQLFQDYCPSILAHPSPYQDFHYINYVLKPSYFSIYKRLPQNK